MIKKFWEMLSEQSLNMFIFCFILIAILLSTQVHYTFLKLLYGRLKEDRIFQTNFVQNSAFQKVPIASERAK